MSAREMFESIFDTVRMISKAELDIKAMRLRVGSHSQSIGPMGKGTVTDVSDSVLAIIQAEIELDRLRAKVEPEIEFATSVLYGSSGHGGLARLRGTTDADCICGHYIMGMTWKEVADEMVDMPSLDSEQWCKRRAYRALSYLEACDMEELSQT